MKDPKSRALRKYVRKKRRRRQIKTIFAGLLLVLCLMGAASFLNPKTEAQTQQPESYEPAAAGVENNAPIDSETLKELEVLAGKNGKVQGILDHIDQYPSELLEMLARNEETLDFVADYPAKKNEKCADTIGNVTKGTVPLLLQWDERWGYGEYGDSIIAVSGCGPTALSMVVAGVTGNNEVTPYQIARYAMEQGYYVKGTGTSWDLMRSGCEYFGIKASEVPLNENAVARELKMGNPIICSMRPGDFTTTGHFIVLTGYEDGKIQVKDPNSKERSGRTWEYERLASQINNMWVYKKM